MTSTVTVSLDIGLVGAILDMGDSQIDQSLAASTRLPAPRVRDEQYLHLAEFSLALDELFTFCQGAKCQHPKYTFAHGRGLQRQILNSTRTGTQHGWLASRRSLEPSCRASSSFREPVGGHCGIHVSQRSEGTTRQTMVGLSAWHVVKHTALEYFLCSARIPHILDHAADVRTDHVLIWGKVPFRSPRSARCSMTTPLRRGQEKEIQTLATPQSRSRGCCGRSFA
jgi:hypothetical protein